MNNECVIHKNRTNWGTVWHLITSDGMGHLQAYIEDENPNTMFFCGLSVMPEVRNRGIGKSLLHIGELLGKQYKVERLRLNVEKPDIGLNSYYEKLGYEFWDEDEEYIYLIKYNKNE